MSLENVIAFWSKVRTDKDLQKKVHPGDKIPKLSKDVKGADLDELAKVATAAGFACTGKELAATEAVIRFWGAVPKDDKLKAALSAVEKLDEKKAAAETVRIAGAHGYQFSVDELNTISPVVLAAQTGALSEDQLDAVSGGAVAPMFQVGASLNLAVKGGFTVPNFRIGPGSVAQYM